MPTPTIGVVQGQLSMVPVAAAIEKKIWVMLFMGNLLASKGLDLHFEAPTIKDGFTIVQLDQDETGKESVKWQNSMIFCMLRDSPIFAALDRFISLQWNFSMKPMFFHNVGYFMLKFESASDRDEAVLSGMHLINSKPIIVKPWRSDFNFNEEMLKTILLWVKIGRAHV